jgi:hypothetical protein
LTEFRFRTILTLDADAPSSRVQERKIHENRTGLLAALSIARHNLDTHNTPSR